MVNENGDETNMVAKQNVSVTSPHRKCFVAAIIYNVFLVINLVFHIGVSIKNRIRNSAFSVDCHIPEFWAISATANLSFT